MISPEPVHLLHIVQRDHAISQDNVQQAIRAEQELTTEVFPVQLCNLHEHPHCPGVNLVWVFSEGKKNTIVVMHFFFLLGCKTL